MHLRTSPSLKRLSPALFAKGALGSGSTRLKRFDSFGSNPGKLNAWHFVPEGAEGQSLPLVVVLHGCTQTAQGYDHGSGWSELAEAYGFAVLFPEQQRSNNPNLCFNWFSPGHTARGGGEALSIAQMIDAMVERHGVDPQRVFITGLSAGGAMTSVMLAAYPEKFAAGAIMAGLPHGAAASVQEALQQMSAHQPSARTTGQSLKSASRHQGNWPAVSIWHGTADTVVSPTNADAIVQQWQEVHGLAGTPAQADIVAGYPRRQWRDAAGKLLVEEYRVTGMGHGTPLATTGECGCGQAGAFMLEVGISSTVHSAQTWGLLEHRREIAKRERPAPTPETAAPEHLQQAPSGVENIINDALRAAGLLK